MTVIRDININPSDIFSQLSTANYTEKALDFNGRNDLIGENLVK